MSLAERTVRPRLEDAVEDHKHLLRVHGAVEWLVVDVAHTFHNIPMRSAVHVRKGRYSVPPHHSLWYGWKVLSQYLGPVCSDQ